MTAPGASVSSRRRCAQVRKREKEVNSIVKCLNEMYCAAVPPGKAMQETSAQRSSHHEIFKQLGRLKQPKIRCNTREAIKELLHSPVSYNGDENMTTVRPYERSLVSLPNCGADPIPLHEVLDDDGREVLKGAAFSMLLSEEEWGEIVEKGDFVRPYMDSRLQSDETLYHQFAKDLWEKGMIDFTQQPGDLVTPFFVNKKDGRLRFILDCRGVNRRFKPPPPMALAAGSSWAQVSVPAGSTLYCAQSDIKDYFYSLALPSSLQSLFVCQLCHDLRWRLGASTQLICLKLRAQGGFGLDFGWFRWVGAGRCILLRGPINISVCRPLDWKWTEFWWRVAHHQICPTLKLL